MKILHKTCPVCNMPFERPAFGGHLKQVYCSRACANRPRSEKASLEKSKRRRACEECGQEFCPKKCRSRFCGYACSGKYRHRTSPMVRQDKRCRECGQTFNGLQSISKFCSPLCRQRAYQKVNPDWRYSYRYGLSREDYYRMLESQDGRCAICSVELGGSVKSHVDHEHDSDPIKVRGILCASCNHGLGKFKDDPSRLRAAAVYLEKSHGAE